MASLNHTNAIIFDLWDNRGGYSGMVSLIAAYFFDHSGVHVRSTVNPTPHSSTRLPVAGNRLTAKPVYVLTSGSTISAAEQFCYALNMLKRVTLIGFRQKAVGGFRAKWPNTILIHTPIHASWLNQVEIYFSIVQRKVLNPHPKRLLFFGGTRTATPHLSVPL